MKVSVKTGNREFKYLRQIIVSDQWLNQERQNRVNRWDSFIWLTAYWTRVRCTESRSWSDYTADREAKAMLCSVELDPKWAGAERTVSQHQFPTKSFFFLYHYWAQGGTLQLAVSYCPSRLEHKLKCVATIIKVVVVFFFKRVNFLYINVLSLSSFHGLLSSHCWASCGKQNWNFSGIFHRFCMNTNNVVNKGHSQGSAKQPISVIWSASADHPALHCVCTFSIQGQWVRNVDIDQLFIRLHMVCSGGPTTLSRHGPWY